MSFSPPQRIRSAASATTKQEDLINAYEAEEERIINVLSRKLEQVSCSSNLIVIVLSLPPFTAPRGKNRARECTRGRVGIACQQDVPRTYGSAAGATAAAEWLEFEYLPGDEDGVPVVHVGRGPQWGSDA